MNKRYDVAIIGGGPAGLTSGIYAGRAGKSAVVFEREALGGQIINTGSVDNYPAAPGINGAEYAFKLQEQAESFGTELIMEEVTGITRPEEKGGAFVITTPYGSYEATSIILATGLSHRRMGIEREESFIGKGISFCAVCDGMFFRNRNVAVYGGGNTAVEDATYLTNICKSVTIIHRRDRFRAEQHLVEELKAKENVVFAMEKTVSAVKGERRLQGLTLTDVNTGETEEIAVDGLFVAIGQIPNGKIFSELVATDEAGYYMIGEDCASAVPGVFVAGDGRNKQVRQLTTAVSDGAIAATMACRYVDRLAGNEYV